MLEAAQPISMTGSQTLDCQSPENGDAVCVGTPGVGLLIHKAVYSATDSGHTQNHSHPKQVGEVTRQDGAKHLIWPHLAPWVTEGRLMNNAGFNFSGKITVATDCLID
jgi:ribonuclease BN (tRNA processing enzyme)